MLRIVPTSDEELQKVQELQDLEELQVPGATAGVAFGETPPPHPASARVPCFAPPKSCCRVGMGLGGGG